LTSLNVYFELDVAWQTRRKTVKEIKDSSGSREMTVHHSSGNRFDDDVIVLDDDGPTRRPRGHQRFTLCYSSLIVVAYEDLTGNIVVVDLVSDDEEVMPLDRANAAAPEDSVYSFAEITVDDALREILQVLPDIDPKVMCPSATVNGSTFKNDLNG
jgi:hypothetical protein